MQIKSVRLRDYRSYETLLFNPSPGLNVLVGENAAGKTNVLESLFLCALGRSHRTRHDVELIREGASGALVRLSLLKATGNHEIECRIYRDKARELKINHTPLTRSGELLGCLHIVMFSPEDLKLIKQGPGERRRFLDMELSQIQPSYYYALQQYNTALRQRNALLKTHGTAAHVHAPWERQLAARGAQLQKSREAFIASLSGIAFHLHEELSDGKERLHITYAPSVCANQGASLEEALLQAFETTREKDIVRGSTSIGPHRDDLLILLNDSDVRAFGSQGQQRTAALSLKLSELFFLREQERELPVLLLDDVLSELDCARQRCLTKAIEGCQTFLTCTHLSGLADAGIEHMSAYLVHNGAIEPVKVGNN